MRCHGERQIWEPMQCWERQGSWAMLREAARKWQGSWAMRREGAWPKDGCMRLRAQARAA
jgi:hypothetical protein